MAKTLHQLLNRIDPERSINYIERRVHRALASFHVPFHRIRSHRQLRLLLAYFEYRLTHWPDADPKQFPMEEASKWYATVYQRMRARYGEMPETTVMHIAQTGVEGGIYGVLKKIADHYIYEQSRKDVKEAVDEFWRAQSLGQKRDAISQYWRRYRRTLLPGDIRSPDDWRLKGNFPSVLRKHPNLVRNRRRIADAFDRGRSATRHGHWRSSR